MQTGNRDGNFSRRFTVIFELCRQVRIVCDMLMDEPNSWGYQYLRISIHGDPNGYLIRQNRGFSVHGEYYIIFKMACMPYPFYIDVERVQHHNYCSVWDHGNEYYYYNHQPVNWR